MQTQRMGVTLLELLIALTLLGIVISLAAPALRSTMQVLAVRAARESAVGAFARARAIALHEGGAAIELSARDDRITVRAPSGAIAHELLLAPHDVDLLPDGSTDPVQLNYDAYGLGRMMSRTITLQAGGTTAGLTISSFGRVRRW
ncbi:MAG TPA: prepilin-type N-terminal cleavage/methylation domain-containing protein [Longimicrobiales bacterium]